MPSKTRMNAWIRRRRTRRFWESSTNFISSGCSYVCLVLPCWSLVVLSIRGCLFLAVHVQRGPAFHRNQSTKFALECTGNFRDSRLQIPNSRVVQCKFKLSRVVQFEVPESTPAQHPGGPSRYFPADRELTALPGFAAEISLIQVQDNSAGDGGRNQLVRQGLDERHRRSLSQQPVHTDIDQVVDQTGRRQHRNAQQR